ncbi:RNase P/MRP, p29 subunit [Clavulina sp. PMI_390]|nr:RNase P/MRP, p29 subunit [Clavulina sp. PMI_390]
MSSSTGNSTTTASGSGNPQAQVDIYKSFSSLRGQKVTFSSATPFVPTYVQSNTPSNPAAYTSRVQDRQILLENPVRESRAKKTRDAQRARQEKDAIRRKAGVMSRREAKRSGAWVFDKNEIKYDTFLPIHHMWCTYMGELLNLPAAPPPQGTADAPVQHRMPSAATMQPKLVKAEFNGAIIEVTDSRNKSLIGCRGIVIFESENTFKIVTQKDAVKVIPKENSIFTFDIPLYPPPPLDPSSLRAPSPEPADPSTSSSSSAQLPISSHLESSPKIRFQLYGNQFRFRSADRATRKFKPKETIEL